MDEEFTVQIVFISLNIAILTSKMIHNIRRSGDMADPISVQVGYGTEGDHLDELESVMKAFVQENKRDYLSVDMSLREIDCINKLTLSFWLSYKGNFQDGGRFARRRANFLRRLHTVMQELKIQYTLPMQPMQGIPVNSLDN